MAQENKHVNSPDYLVLRELVLDIYSSDLDTNKQKKAVETIKQIGPSVVPELTRLSKDPDTNVRAGAISALGLFLREVKGALPILIDALKATDEAVKIAAAGTLMDIGPEGTPAVPYLIDVIKDTELRKSGSSAIFYAAAALGGIGPPARSAIPALKSLLNDRRVSLATQSEAMTAIDLIQRNDPDPKVRANVARGLAGTGRSNVIPILTELLNDPDEYVRRAAKDALIFMDVLTLLDKVQGKDNVERLKALKALGDIGHAAEWGELIISRCLTDSNEEIRRAAADALKKIKGK